MRPGSKTISTAGKQRGAAMMIFVLLLVMGGLTYLLSGLSSEGFSSRREKQTQEALALAREALIGYALRYREISAASDPDSDGDDDRRMYGLLPMPDTGTTTKNLVMEATLAPPCVLEGCANRLANGAFPQDSHTIIGRFPWRTLGLDPVRDGNGECLWYVVSANHKNLGIDSSIPKNWDTLGHLDVVVADGSAALTSTLASAHDRPVAIVFSPGPALPEQDRSDATNGDDVSKCGGNYDARNYLDPFVSGALGGVTNYLAGPTKASGPTGDSAPALKALSVGGKIFSSDGVFRPAGCQGGDCSLLANDLGLPLTSNELFGAIRKHAYFRTDINAMLDRITGCLRDKIAGGGVVVPDAIAGFTPPADKNAGRVATDSCHDDTQPPLGYFGNYGNQVFVATPTSGSFSVSGDPSCAGVLVFASQRGPGQSRGTAAERNEPGNYLEGDNLTNFVATGTTFSGPSLLGRVSATQSSGQDIVRCIPAGAAFTPTVSAPLTTAGLDQIVAYDAATSTLTIGAENVTTGDGAPASALFGCAWLADARTMGSGLRTYFNFQFKKIGTNVGENGFVFALADALNNTLTNCGAAGAHLGYSGDNGNTAKIAPPKIGIEFDQSRNPGYSETADPTLSGRNDPLSYNSHAAIVYWGHGAASVIDIVTLPNFDDNVHGFPTLASVVGAPTPPPRNPADPSSGIAFKDLRGNPDDSHLFHIRVEVSAVEPSVKLAAARTATGSNINLASPGVALGGVTLLQGDRVLVIGQSIAAENGVYVWQGPTTPMTRVSDAASGADFTQAVISVTQGVNAESDWQQVATAATDPQSWQPFVRKFRTEVWVHSNSAAVNQIAAIRNVTRPMSLLNPGYAPTLTDTATMYAVPATACVNRTCPNGQTCGADNICYRPPLKSVQVGFTGSQNTTDQQVNIRDFFSTWLP